MACPVLEPAGSGQVVPIDLKRIEPETVIKVSLRAGLSGVRGNQQLGIGFGLRIVGVARDLHAMHVAVPDLLGLRGPERAVTQHGRNRVVEDFPGSVTQFDLEHGHGDAGIPAVEGDERVEGLQLDEAREPLVGKTQTRDREPAIQSGTT